MADLPVALDNLKHEKSMIDLDGHSSGDFGLEDYVLTKVFDDILLVEFIDEVSDSKGTAIMRNGLYVPTNVLTKNWRKGKVLIKGVSVTQCEVGDIVVFPNDRGVTVGNIDVMVEKKVKKIKSGMFLSEQRLFGVCKEK